MNETLGAALSELLAEIPVGSLPVDAPGYGSDLSCADDVDPLARELDGSDPLLVAQAAYRMITTARGSLIDAPDRGIDVAAYLHEPGTTAEELAGVIRGELQHDDRIDALEVSVERSPDGFEIEIGGTLASSGEAFELVLGLTDAGALLRAMNGGAAGG